MEKTKKPRGRPKLAPEDRRREVRTFVAARDADQLAKLAEQHDVSEGAILALLWRLSGDYAATEGGFLASALSKHLTPVAAAALAPGVGEAIEAGKVRTTLVDGELMVDGASFRVWLLR